ncbi:Tetratricopeptide TPR_1 repeat-containing protein [Thalassoporum mexicanum PCC 7367]|uniref:tetratricopeptide repeat protein n=1 Tax=Thalassoporum mexicanum TaxID=3457544 RepID=UPI00029F8415|nr:tetratricopeptide repeat protein [Pseudanabaena sp. PCC 7367]AFY69375.1 Tetratricopeptide TPR_1 repeat-containing protein [Pseudanabaena sp. PCC 7367]
MYNPEIPQLLDDLKQDDEAVRDRATRRLWQIWFGQKGEHGREQLQRADTLMSFSHILAAEELLNDLIETHPDFAEAWNRRAILYYTEGKYEKAIADCQKVVELAPYHFGAWHGLGLCLAEMGEYGEASQAFRRAIAIQPHALINQRLMLECMARLTP